MPGFSAVVTYDRDCAGFRQTSPRATSILDQVVVSCRGQNVQKPTCAWCISLRLCRTRISCDGAWPIWDPSKRSRAIIVSLLCVFARSEAVYDMHCIPLRAVFLHQGSQKGHRLRPTGRSVSGIWMHL